MIRRRRDLGVGLLEMMITALILTILACVALPNSMQIALNTNGAIAANALRTMDIVNFAYKSTAGSYAPNMAALFPNYSNAALTPAPGVTQGYTYAYTSNGTSFTYTATPVNPKGQSFFTNGSNVTYSNSGPATAASPVVTYFPHALPPGPPGAPGAAGAQGPAGSSGSGPAIITYSGIYGIPGPFSNGSSFYLNGPNGTNVHLSPPQPGTDDGKVITVVVPPSTNGYENGTPANQAYNISCPTCYDPSNGTNDGQDFAYTTIGSHNNPGTPTIPAAQFVAYQGNWYMVGSTVGSYSQ